MLTGVALGLAFNQLGLSSRPPHGLPWIAVARHVDSLDSLVHDPAVTGSTPAGPSAAPPSGSGRPLADETHVPAHGSPSIAPPIEAKTGAAGGSSLEGAADSPPLTRGLGAELPAIPDVGRPLRVELPTVARFVEAGAALLVDARDDGSFADGHIPGAVNIPYDEAVRDPSRIERVDSRGRPIIVYCSGGTCEASRMLAEMMMRDFNKRRVLIYEAGFPEWAAAGRPVARGGE